MISDKTALESVQPGRTRLPPRWVIRTIWVLHRAASAASGGRLGLRSATADRAGYLELRTTGRRSGKLRRSILAYHLDGPNLITLAMNGWADSEPAWWLNLLAQPDARVDMPGESRRVRGRAADPDERARLWARFDAGPWGDVNAFAARRSRETAIVILEPAESAKPD